MKGRITINIRRALPCEAILLSQLAFESKSVWGYDQDYLEAARIHIRISERDIYEDHVFVVEDDVNIFGFYHFKRIEPELIWFFVNPRSVGKGIGRLLWNHLIKIIKELGITEFIIKSDPNAESFYIKQGAKRIGLKSSTVNENMKLPLLKYTANNSCW